MPSPEPENPYQPPAADPTVPPAATPVPAAGTFLKDPRTRGWAAISFIELVSLLSVARVFQPDTDAIRAFLQLALIVTLLCAIVAHLAWIHLAATNARQMDRHSGVKPAWAVGCYFIPFVNWIMPALTMKEIVDATFRHRSANGLGFVIAIWWVAYMGMNILWRVVPGSGVSAASTCVAGVSIAVLIVRISNRQAAFRWSEVPGLQRPLMTAASSPRHVAATRIPAPRSGAAPASRPRRARPGAVDPEEF